MFRLVLYIITFEKMAKNAVKSTPDTPKRRRKRMMSDAEVITILICFHFNSYRNFKHYYQACVCAFRTALESGNTCGDRTAL